MFAASIKRETDLVVALAKLEGVVARVIGTLIRMRMRVRTFVFAEIAYWFTYHSQRVCLVGSPEYFGKTRDL